MQGSNGETITFERDLGESVIIWDINGDVFGVGPTAGSAVLLQAGASFVPSSSNTTGINSSGNVTAFNHTKAKVTFKRSSASKFADDEMPTGVNPKIIAKYKKVGDYNYYYKGAANDGKATRSTEFIDAEIEIFNNALTVDKISFNIKGSAAIPVGTPRTAGNKIMLTLEVPVFETVKELELLAIVSAASASDKRTVVGAAMIVPTKILPIVNVTLVPVNGATIPANVQADLQKIYGGIGVTITVAIAPNYTSTITTLECGTSGFMANYTAEQKTFINTYTALKPAEANQYYVFLMNNITPSRPIRGFMPLHRQTGFVFPNQIAASDPKEVNKGSVTNTIAHEIGHGIFELEHPWEDYQYTKGSQLTNWLMDTEGGIKLPYMHWQKISHPKFGLYVFQKDESGESVIVSNIIALIPLKTGNSYTFLSPAAMPITLPANLKSLEFFDEEELGNEKTPLGALRSFVLNDNTRYVATYENNTNNFNGYYNFIQKKWYVDNLTKTEPSGGKVIFAKNFIKSSKYFIKLYFKEYDASSFPGYTAWPKSDNYKASGLTNKAVFESNTDILLFGNANVELALNQYDYSTEKSNILKYFEGLKESITLRNVITLANLAHNNKSKYAGFKDCNASDFNNIKPQNYTTSALNLKDNFKSFIANNNRKTEIVWHNELRTIINDNSYLNTNICSLLQKLKETNCLNVPKEQAIERLSFAERINVINKLKAGNVACNGIEKNTYYNLILKSTPSIQRNLNYITLITSFLKEFAYNGLYDEELVLLVIENIKNCNSINIDEFLNALKSTPAGESKCIFEKLIYKFSDVAFDNDENFQALFETLLSIKYKSNSKNAQIAALQSTLNFTNEQLFTYTNNANAKNNIFVWNGTTEIANTNLEFKVETKTCQEFKFYQVLNTSSITTTYSQTAIFNNSVIVASSEQMLTYMDDWVLLVDVKNKTTYPVPAMFVYFLIQNANNKFTQKVVTCTLHVVSLATGAAAITAGAKGIQLLVALSEITSGLSGLATTALEPELRSLLGNDGYQNLQTVTALVDIAGISIQTMPGIAKKADNLLTRLDNIDFNTNLTPAKLQLKAIKDKLASVFGRGVNGAGKVIDDFIANVSKYDDVIEKSASELTQAEKVLKESFEQADDVGSFTQRTAQDIKYEQYRATKGSGTATKTGWQNRNIGTLAEPNQIKDGFCSQFENISGVEDIRINQSQTLVNKNAVGINRPDIQFTYQGKRYYIEIDAAASNRGVPHKNRIVSNDPTSNVNLPLPTALQNISVTVNGKIHTLSGGITLIQL